MYADNALGFVVNPATVTTATTVFNSLRNVFGGGKRPLLFPVSAISDVLAQLSPSERAQADAVLRPFGWYQGVPENVVGKIAAELRDAENPTEIALYNFFVSRFPSAVSGNPTEPGASTGQPPIGEDLFDALKDRLFRRAAGSAVVRDAAGNIIAERSRELSYQFAPIALLIAAAATAYALTRPKRNPPRRRRRSTRRRR